MRARSSKNRLVVEIPNDFTEHLWHEQDQVAGLGHTKW